MRMRARACERWYALGLAVGVAACSGNDGSPRSSSGAKPGDQTAAVGTGTEQIGPAPINGAPQSINGANLSIDLDDATSDTADAAVVRVSVVKDGADIPLSGIAVTCEILAASGSQLAKCPFAESDATTTVTVKKVDLKTAKVHVVISFPASKETQELKADLVALSGAAREAYQDIKIWPFGAQPLSKTLSAASYCDTSNEYLPGVTGKNDGADSVLAAWSPDTAIGLPTDGCFRPFTDYASDHGMAILALSEVVSGRYAQGPAGAPFGCGFGVLGKEGKSGDDDRLIVVKLTSAQDAYDFRATTFKYRCKQ
jgi:hypothetical protein